MRLLRLVAVLMCGGVGLASAQLAITQPTEKLILLPLPASAGDSAASVAVMDQARDRVQQLARYKVQLIPKSKLCEAFAQFGFGCDYILDQTQAAQFARALSINSYNVGSFTRTGNAIAARVRLISGSSGFSSIFNISGDGQQAVAESLAQHVVTIIKAAEYARECDDRRSKGNLPGALESAKKAFALDPNLTAGHLCVLTVYEAQHLPPDSEIVAALRALKGDSLNATAWARLASAYQQKGDTLRWLDALQSQVRVEPTNKGLLLGVGRQLMTSHQFPKSTALLKAGLSQFPNDATVKGMIRESCIDGEQWRCVLDLLAQEERDSAAKLNDSTELKLAIGASQALPDSQALLHWTALAVKNFPRNLGFLNTRGTALENVGMIDSAVAAYKAAVALLPTDARLNLLVAATIINHLDYDTLKAPKAADSVALGAYRNAFADRMDQAKPYLQPALVSSDSALRLNGVVLLLTGGSKLARVPVYDRAYPWLDQLLTTIPQASPADTLGPKQQIRVQGSFWFGLSSTLTLGGPYKALTEAKSCDLAKAFSERLTRTRDALFLGGRIAPSVATQMLGFITRYSQAMAQVKAAFKCTNF